MRGRERGRNLVVNVTISGEYQISPNTSSKEGMPSSLNANTPP
jgi:hypothetical protein